MILAGLLKNIKDTELLNKILEYDSKRDRVLGIIANMLTNLFIEDLGHNASTTNLRKIKEIIDELKI